MLPGLNRVKLVFAMSTPSRDIEHDLPLRVPVGDGIGDHWGRAVEQRGRRGFLNDLGLEHRG